MTGYYRDCQVRLAVETKGKFPDYLIQMLIFDEETGTEVIHEQSICVCSGRRHDAEVAGADNLMRLWSSAAMRYEDVQQLLGELRGLR